jgi:hypothetical protein
VFGLLLLSVALEITLRIYVAQTRSNPALPGKVNIPEEELPFGSNAALL